MRKPRPLQWIEEAEARRVMLIALSECPAPLPPPRSIWDPGQWVVRIRLWTVATPRCPIPENDAPRSVRVEPLRR
jgi:hypothetical protein